jgi:two-component system sensor histidine kinase/response regulator
MVKTILIADDEPNQIATLEAFLRERGYKVIAAMSGEQALTKAISFQPDLIILDIMMPTMDGTEVAMLLRNDIRTKHIPVFFVTAVIAPDDQARVSGSPNLIFAKPVKLNDLLQAIHNATAENPNG